MFYVSPMDSPLFQPQAAPQYWRALWIVALPFIAVGCWLTLRRLRDARLSPWYLVLFFVPFANLLFFAVAAIAPSREPPKEQSAAAGSGYREGRPIVTRLLGERRSYGASVLMAGGLGAAIGLGAVGISVGILRTYGGGLMLGAPLVAGFA